MRPPAPKHDRYDGSTVERQPAQIGGFFFAVWGTEYAYSQAAPLVRAAKRTDPHFKRVLEQDSDPTIVDVVLAQDTLLGIFRQLKPLGS